MKRFNVLAYLFVITSFILFTSALHVDTFKVDPLCTEVTDVSISFDR